MANDQVLAKVSQELAAEGEGRCPCGRAHVGLAWNPIRGCYVWMQHPPVHDNRKKSRRRGHPRQQKRVCGRSLQEASPAAVKGAGLDARLRGLAQRLGEQSPSTWTDHRQPIGTVEIENPDGSLLVRVK